MNQAGRDWPNTRKIAPGLKSATRTEHRNRSIVPRMVGAAVAVAAPLPAVAQEADSHADDDIIVTARRVQESARKIPVALTVVSADGIERLAINTPLDLNKIAGLGGAPVGALTSVNFTLRGQGTAFGGQPGVISYFAEVPGFPLTYFDLDSVQVIKGPQGTLFGQTSIGGVVLFGPKRPVDRLEGTVSVQAGNHDYGQFEGALNVPLTQTLAVRLAFQVRERDGWAKAVHPDGSTTDISNVDTISGRLSVRWRPSPSVENYTIFAVDRIRNNGTLSPLYYIDPRFMNPAVRNLAPSAVPSIAAGWTFWTGSAPVPGQTFSQALAKAFEQQLNAGPLTMYTDYSQRNETINLGLINQTSWEIAGNLRFRNIFGLRTQTVQGAIYDQDATALPLLDYQCRFVPGTTSANGTCARTGGWPDRTVTEEIQFQGHFLRGKLQWQAGGFYLATGARNFTEDSKPFIVFGTLSGDPASAAYCASVNVASPCASMSRTNTRSEALFAQATYEIVRNVHLTAGYRETWDRSQTDSTAKASYQVPFDGALIAVPVYGQAPAAGATTVSTIVDLPANGSYNVSADWQTSDQTLVYVAHRSGYETGGINAVANPGTPQRTYGPERVKDVEVGIKGQWSFSAVHVRLDADFYHTWFTNIQEGEIIPGTAQTITTNLANARINGVEVQASLDGTWFRLSGNIAFTDAHYTNWLENSTCAAQYWRPQCANLAGSTAIVIDHANGVLDIAGQQINFTPDRFANTSRWQWAFQPALLLDHWTGRDIQLSANLYHRGPYVDAVAVANTSKLAGVPMATENTVYGYATANPYDAPGYTLLDLRLDWRHVSGSRVSLAAAVTNVTNTLYRVSSASAFEIIGAAYSITGEPRMAFVQVKYDF
jgi:iron complex outermembrane receptor protein